MSCATARSRGSVSRAPERSRSRSEDDVRAEAAAGFACDYAVVGAGIVGLATALAIVEHRAGAVVLVLEKEAEAARHQTGHNSGVIHAGVYYAPGSLKARLCREGNEATRRFCEQHGVPFEVCGKLIVATSALEAERLAALAERCRANQLAVEELSGEQLRAIEPHIRGSAALRVQQTGIVDYRLVCAALQAEPRRLAGNRRFPSAALEVRRSRGCVARSRAAARRITPRRRADWRGSARRAPQAVRPRAPKWRR